MGLRVVRPGEGETAGSGPIRVRIIYFRDVGTLAVGENGLLDPAAVGRVMKKYATEVVAPPPV